jgi:hypothetical protein
VDGVERRRQQVEWNIRQNPTEIMIKRTQKTPIRGHFEETKSEIGPFIVRLFKKSQGRTQEVSNLGGTKQNDNGWGLLADYQADIKDGSMITDEFEVPGIGCFQVTSVFTQKLNEQVVGLQVDLEKVN